ncbi:acetate kinase [Paraburkholderia fungorum]|uniref:Acetate kinase n=1 Tax=Paraburkholderia fungorum TaxID=134537 RepID=A0AAW3V7F6_9BURK|nr:acetate kinase [Paraburkholderia fungorum]
MRGRLARRARAAREAFRGHRLNAIVFTAGIGEYAAPVRERVCRAAAWLGVSLDAQANAQHGPRISDPQSAVDVWVIPTNEELMIARHGWHRLES